VEKELLEDARRRMDKSIEATQVEFNTVRTGRASTAVLDRVTVDYYGTTTPLKQLASLSTPEPRLLTVSPYDKGAIKVIEKALRESDLGLNPSNDGQLIRLPVPQLTEERRRELVKLVHRLAEDGKIAIRNVRRDVLKDFKEAKTEGVLGEDAERRAEEHLQKLTDEHVHKIDELLKRKEAEILEV